MKLHWKIEDSDISNVKNLLDKMEDRPFVIKRRQNNIENPPTHLSKEQLWKAMIACLLTTRQRSGPNSASRRFRQFTPYPLELKECKHRKDIANFVDTTITKFGGIRRGRTIGKHIRDNLKWLENGGWNQLSEWVAPLSSTQKVQVERKAANLVANNLKGFGPKQSRNFWQQLGLTVWEIPLDSRITRWLNEHGFPVKLTAKGLSDSNYYNFILDGIRTLSREAGTYPCILDAAIFTSYDSYSPS